LGRVAAKAYFTVGIESASELATLGRADIVIVAWGHV
jgi:hypothetical protein